MINQLIDALGRLNLDASYLEVASIALRAPTPIEERTEQAKQLEYIGDGVLELIVREHFCQTRPANAAHALALDLVSNKSLGLIAKQLDLPSLIWGDNPSLYPREWLRLASDHLEALIGGIYQVGGLAAARQFIETQVIPRYEPSVNRLDLAKLSRNNLWDRPPGLRPPDLEGTTVGAALTQRSQKSYGCDPIIRSIYLQRRGSEPPEYFYRAAVIINNQLAAVSEAPELEKAEEQAMMLALSRHWGESPKLVLDEYCWQEYKLKPEYRVVEDLDPGNGSTIYTVTIMVLDHEVGKSQHHSRKEAEALAAEQGILYLATNGRISLRDP